MSVMLQVNGQPRRIEQARPDEPLLWVLREDLGLVGTRHGCAEGVCGACTVHLDGQPVRSCVTPCAAAHGAAVTTIEGLGGPGDTLHPVQQAWMALRVPQCGYCQSGQMMGAAALLRANPAPTDADIDAAMAGHLCRCGTQRRVRAAIHEAARRMRGRGQ